jgi:hypothetical protein
MELVEIRPKSLQPNESTITEYQTKPPGKTGGAVVGGGKINYDHKHLKTQPEYVVTISRKGRGRNLVSVK